MDREEEVGQLFPIGSVVEVDAKVHRSFVDHVAVHAVSEVGQVGVKHLRIGDMSIYCYCRFQVTFQSDHIQAHASASQKLQLGWKFYFFTWKNAFLESIQNVNVVPKFGHHLH